MAHNTHMDIPSITGKHMAAVDRVAVEHGLEILQMMEHAGLHVARGAFDARKGEGTAVVLCGKGNNGADGLAAARHLANWGLRVEVVLAAPAARLNRYGKRHLAMAKRMGCRVSRKPKTRRPSVILDALLGYNLEGDPRGAYAALIEWANQGKAPVVACDTPSGLEVTRGIPKNPCVVATHTVTLALPKTGLLEASAAPYVGTLWLADLGIPNFVYRKLHIPVTRAFAQGSMIKL